MTDFLTLRTAMVDCQVRPSDVTKFPIIDAMLNVRREAFVPSHLRDVAYAGEHIDLGAGRVVLDPRVFAKMLDALDISKDDLVLDIGCTTGYSSAVIARLAEAVIALEEDETLTREAEAALAAESIDNALLLASPLSKGAAKHGPYDAIVVSGGVETMPAEILAQLKLGGRIAAVFMDGALGQCWIGLKTANGIAWRAAFDATAPLLPGFQAAEEFAL